VLKGGSSYLALEASTLHSTKDKNKYSNNKLSQLGRKDVASSQLMFAKFSPDDKQVAYVLNNDIYVQSLNDMIITQLTNSAGNSIINGLFDWVYEEEFMIRDGFRWSPDGKMVINLTKGDFDITEIKAVDEKSGWLYFIASPKTLHNVIYTAVS
jgi:hypothetical protein